MGPAVAFRRKVNDESNVVSSLASESTGRNRLPYSLESEFPTPIACRMAHPLGKRYNDPHKSVPSGNPKI